MKRQITAADILPMAQYAKSRGDLRRALIPTKKLRRIEVGPFACFYFENFDTMRAQVQEMLYIEKGGPEQIDDELKAYNPMIPQGQNLACTMMLEIDDPERRTSILLRLTNIEEHAFIQIGDDKIYADAEQDIDRTAEDGKTSAVHFLHFNFTPAQIKAFKDSKSHIIIGFDHDNYAHMAVMQATTRAELAKDFA